MAEPAVKATAEPRPRVSTIVVSYNTVEMTLAALRSYFETTKGENYELLVVDNDSSDGSADAIEAAFPADEYPEMRLFRLDENIGFGRANNFAALKAQGEYLLLLNPDTIVYEGAVQKLMAFADRRPEAKIWGGRTLYEDGELNPCSCWRRMSLWSLTSFAFGLSGVFSESEFFNPEGYGGWQRDTEREVDIVTGCFFLIKADFWKQLEGFDERIFMYAEEADLCLRARDLGAKPWVTPEAVIVHHGGGSEKAFGPKIGRLFAGKLSLARKRWPAWRVAAARGLLRLAVLIRKTAYGVLVRLRGRESDRQNHTAWSQAWSARGEWLKGYL